MKLLQITILCLISSFVISQSQNFKSIHQEQSEYYNSLGKDYQYYDENYVPPAKPVYEKSSCNLEKRVFGWQPYWNNAKHINYRWDLLSDLSYFSYEVNVNTGQDNANRGFATASSVTEALANGVRVNLCVTLFEDHLTLFNNATAQQTLITNLINLVKNRSAHGVNIDFEKMNSTHKAGFTAFMASLSTQMKAQIPGSELSVALPAVEWSSTFDIPALNQHVDLFCIMGYDYYYSGSTNAGPTDPLYLFDDNYKYTLSKSVTDYINKGVPKSKIILGLPYYGRHWQVNNFNTTPASTVPITGGSVTFADMKSNSGGKYGNNIRNIDNNSKSVYFNYTDANNNKKYQCYISDKPQMDERLDFIRKRDLGGMGIWALGNDDGYPQLWNSIKENLTDCYSSPCSGVITDIGGGDNRDYYGKESYSYTIAPENAENINVQFQSFDVKSGDYLYIYNGPSTSSPQITGSPFTGNSLPPAFTSSSGELTIKFTSAGTVSTVKSSGFKATYSCGTTVVTDPPMTRVDTVAGWKTTNYTQNFVETVPGSDIKKMYYSVAEHNGTEWRANTNNGFFYDNFDNFSIHPDWTVYSGTWSETNVLKQTDDTHLNSNISAPLNQSLSNQHIYHWKGKMGGSGSSIRAGLHIFADDPSAVGRGTSYLVFFRADINRIQIYKMENNDQTTKLNSEYTINAGTWYDYKVIYDRISGDFWIYVNDVLAAIWTDPDPIETGEFVSFRTGESSYEIDDFVVYRSRYPSVQIKIGADTLKDIRYQNPSPSQPSGMIRSLVTNTSDQISQVDSILLNIDWTGPAFNYVNDGNAQTDLDTINVVSGLLQAAANWSANDPNSGVVSYDYSIGISPGDNSIVNWTTVGANNSVILTHYNFVYDELYYFTIRSKNGAGLTSTESSDGFRMVTSTTGLNKGSIEIPKIYPNPATDYLNVELNQIIEEISLYDMNGKLLRKVALDASNAPINVADFASGTYVLRLKTKTQLTEHTWIKK
ncbi:MAG TPA: glycosyl hydrolase family 18 protein [Brumimicrobium sp.]|nr:glycosyl hydrolase family 18 protein [Brumimicrobium sp.]